MEVIISDAGDEQEGMYITLILKQWKEHTRQSSGY